MPLLLIVQKSEVNFRTARERGPASVLFCERRSGFSPPSDVYPAFRPRPFFPGFGAGLRPARQTAKKSAQRTWTRLPCAFLLNKIPDLAKPGSSTTSTERTSGFLLCKSCFCSGQFFTDGSSPTNLLISSNISGEITCSMRQASCSASFSSAPRRVKSSVMTRCRS